MHPITPFEYLVSLAIAFSGHRQRAMLAMEKLIRCEARNFGSLNDCRLRQRWAHRIQRFSSRRVRGTCGQFACNCGPDTVV
jgi:hypothetical protein